MRIAVSLSLIYHPSNPDMKLPVIIAEAAVMHNLPEQMEAGMESASLALMKNVLIDADKEEVVIYGDKKEMALIDFGGGSDVPFFSEFQKVRQVGIEYRFYVSKVDPEADQTLLFSIFGAWDDVGKKWIQEPKSYPHVVLGQKRQ